MEQHDHRMMTQNYGRLLLMAVLSFVAMYVLMYAMVDRVANIHPSLNQAWMAGLMTAPMVVLELLLMGGMYRNRRWNAGILVAAGIAGVACFAAIREQTLIGDRDFARSMISHHGAAILMCREAPLSDPRLRELCRSIIAGQQAEIDQMTAILNAPAAALVSVRDRAGQNHARRPKTTLVSSTASPSARAKSAVPPTLRSKDRPT